MSGQDDDTEKSFDPTPQKLQKAREKGEIARSQDLNTAAAYAGLTLALFMSGASVISGFGTALMTLLDQADGLAPLFVTTGSSPLMAGVLRDAVIALVPLFAIPAVAVVLTIAAQRGFVFAPSKLEPKLSKISIIKNAGNKFGRNGLFEFAKSFVKLVIYSFCLGVFLRARAPEMLTAVNSGPRSVVLLLAELCISFLCVVVLVSLVIGGIDAVWQHFEHIRKNRMSRKDLQDENKDSEGDPHLKQARRQRAQTIAMTQMMVDVPDADVIIVNPTHYAVALKWSRKPGSAPTCVAKGVDEVAARIREIATEHGVPVHRDPPTARALFAVTDIGAEIAPDHYQAVAAAIRFAEAMRQRVRTRGF
jgi:flagellar biosynthetic protein FlhB